MDAQENCTAAVPTDQVGKVFRVVGRQLRKCLICEQVFARQDSAEHASVACWPEKQVLLGKRDEFLMDR